MMHENRLQPDCGSPFYIKQMIICDLLQVNTVNIKYGLSCNVTEKVSLVAIHNLFCWAHMPIIGSGMNCIMAPLAISSYITIRNVCTT